MLEFSPALKEILDGAVDKADWSRKLNDALGNNRLLRCFRDSNAASVDPVVDGVEFLRIGNSGTLVAQAGNIVDFGKLSGVTIRQPADLKTGSCVLILEGNGHRVRGTLGEKGSGKDFTFSASPTARTGIGFGDATIRPPRLLPSGTGPTAPANDPDRPVYVEFEDWRDPNNPKLVKTIVLNQRADDLVFEDVELAADMGDVRVMQSDETIIFDDFEFGATLLSMNPVVSSIPGRPVHQVLVNAKPYGRWESWPAMDTFNKLVATASEFSGVGNGRLYNKDIRWAYAVAETIEVTAISSTEFTVVGSVHGPYPNGTFGKRYGADDSAVYFETAHGTIAFQPGDKFTWTVYPNKTAARPTDVTIPPAFKIKLKRIDGTVLHTFQMRDNLPINSPLLSQVRDENNALRPFWNCAMTLFWESQRPVLNSKRYKWFAGMTPESCRPTQSQQGYSFNGAVPLINGRGQVNSMNHYYAAPRWPMATSPVSKTDPNDPNNDPYIYDTYAYFTATKGPARALWRAVGWDYEPGSISLHDWYTGPGGPRHDRAVIPTALVLYMNDPDGVRLRDGAKRRDMAEAWCKAYFNHSHHYVTDVRKLTTVPNDEICYGKWSYGQSYYGSGTGYVAGGETRHIHQFGIPAGSGGPPTLDRNGNMFFGGWALDNLHTYGTPLWGVLFFNSPAHLISGKMRFFAHNLSQLAAATTKRTSGFLSRNGAWRWMHWCLMWKVGTKHDFGIPRAMIEDRWRMDMECIYNEFVLPATDPTHPNHMVPMIQSLRYLGQLVNEAPGNIKIDPDAIDGELIPDPDNPDGPWIEPPPPTPQKAFSLNSNGLTWYITMVFMLMKQTGSWEAMLNKNEKCKKVMEFMIFALDKFSIDFILDTDGHLESGYPKVGYPGDKSLPDNDPIFTNMPKSWAEVQTIWPGTGQEDWIHNADGTYRGERDVGQHNRAMWAYMRGDYFPEYPNPRLAAAVAKYDDYYNQKAARVAGKATINEARNADWTYRIPSFGRPKPPVNI